MALITYLTRIQFDFGALKLLKEELAALKVGRPLIVTDKGVAKAGLAERVENAVAGPVAAIYDETPANPTVRAASAATAVYRESGADGVIAVGGGSSMDLAKAVALLATHPPPLRQYAMIEGGVPRIGANVAPVVAIPTTAGTGSEVGRGAVIVFEDHRKLALISPHLIPRLALCDPELTLGLPPAITAATGLDAFAHCVETFLSPAINPPAEAIALDGAGRITRHLERAVKDGQDREARWNMMMAAMEGAMAFQKGLGAVHALSHPLGGLEGLALHHGTLNAVVMPAVLRFNAPAVGNKYERLAQTLGIPTGIDLPRWVSDFNRRLGMPPNLKAMGVTQAHADALIDAVLADHCAATNPRKMTRADVQALFADALG
ncbi:MAG TPA: iron-containing alcohol dehydrogenase [Alphaproteobacteria bacterium]|nr:iron-containing alcohol dehydrogenase [Alphaproteobacteria bacterium]